MRQCLLFRYQGYKYREIAAAAEALAAEPAIAFRHRSVFAKETVAAQAETAGEDSPKAPAAEASEGGAAADAPWADPEATLYGAASGTARQEPDTGAVPDAASGSLLLPASCAPP